MALPVAVQLYSVRDSVEADMASALRKIKDMGYDGVEFAGLYGHSADYIRGLLDAIGLVPISAHVPLVEMLATPAVPSSSGRSVSSTKSESATVSIPSMETAETMTGSMLGFIFSK